MASNTNLIKLSTSGLAVWANGKFALSEEAGTSLEHWWGCFIHAQQPNILLVANAGASQQGLHHWQFWDRNWSCFLLVDFCTHSGQLHAVSLLWGALTDDTWWTGQDRHSSTRWKCHFDPSSWLGQVSQILLLTGFQLLTQWPQRQQLEVQFHLQQQQILHGNLSQVCTNCLKCKWDTIIRRINQSRQCHLEVAKAGQPPIHFWT